MTRCLPAKFQHSSIIYEGSLLDLIISFKTRVDLLMYDKPRLDIIAKKSMLDWSAYQEVKLDTNLMTPLGMVMPLTC